MTEAQRRPLAADELRSAVISPDGPWRSIEVVATTGSTNADLIAAAHAGAPSGTVLTAERQTAGRGRLDRRWTSPPSAGILVGVAGDAVVIGIGLNVTLRREELPRADSTSLALAGAGVLDRTALLTALLVDLARRYRVWEAAGGDCVSTGLADAYRANCHTLGREVTVDLPGGETLRGEADDIDNDGRLVVAGIGGRTVVAAGDVHHVRLRAIGCPGGVGVHEHGERDGHIDGDADGPRSRGGRDRRNSLSAIGLDESEERAYRALLAMPEASAEDLVTALNVPFERAEQLLDALITRGLAKMVDGEQFMASAPNSTIGPMLSGRLEEVQYGYDALDELVRVHRQSHALRGTDHLEVVSGAVALRSRTNQLQEQARHDACFLVKPPLVSAPAQNRAPFAEQVRQGVRYRQIYERAMLDDRARMAKLRRTLALGDEIRFIPTMLAKAFIFDQQTAMIFDPDGRPEALVTGHPAIVNMAMALFEQLWAIAVPAPSSTSEQPSAADVGPPDPDDRFLLSLLLAGLTDQAIAVRMGVGLRTVQRRVRELMDAAGVDTRIQLGWQVCRRGWV